MQVVKKKMSLSELKQIAQKGFGNLVKAVVDIEQKIMVVDSELHADQESHLLAKGSKQTSLWGINLYPELYGQKEWIEFDSMINLRPADNNITRGVDSPRIKKNIINVVNNLFQA